MRDRMYGNRGEKKKLSWIYKKKAKSQKTKKVGQNRQDAGQPQKKSRIIVRNLPFKATEDDVKKLYEKFGEIEEINLLKHPDGNPVGCGFIQFKRLQDASKAIFNTNKKEFMGRVISSSWAISKSKFCEKLERESEIKAEDIEVKDDPVTVYDEEPTAGEGEDEEEIKEEDDEEKRMETSKEVDEDTKKGIKRKLPPEQKKEVRKQHKEKKRKKRARIVIRNLSFQATEADIQKHFLQYGNIEEIKILTRSDGKRIGCAFVQFSIVQSAAMAVHYANMQPILGRNIVVDWAIPKDKFVKEVKSENTDDSVEVKVEKKSDSEEAGNSTIDTEIKDENEELGSDDQKEKLTDVAQSDEDDDEPVELQRKEEQDDSLEEDNEADGEDEEEDEEGDEEEESEIKRPRRESHDISEGKTVFLKNVPFSVKNEELKQFMEQFGPVWYALVCIDPLTEHSKGTAFVKFKNLEDAERCLTAGNQLKLRDEIMEAYRALERNDVENKAALKKQKERDSRNLYLVKEGVVLAGSPAAVGVSATDMARRLQLEQWKSQILRNLNMFVARTRLVVHNLPATLDDAMLRKIFERHSNPDAIIREARVMRDLKNVDAKGVGKSKEYGFVSFTRHDDALKALRAINNNPNVFTSARRPIVAFSIENRIMVNAKQRRIEKSREKNPLWQSRHSQENNPENKSSSEKLKFDKGTKSEGTTKSDSQTKFDTKLSKKSKDKNADRSEEKPFTGMIGKPGENKLRSRFKLKTQARLHHQTVKNEKKMSKSAKKLEAKRKHKEAARQDVKPKQGAKVNPDDVHFAKLVKNYKDKLQSVASTRSKWYDT